MPPVANSCSCLVMDATAPGRLAARFDLEYPDGRKETILNSYGLVLDNPDVDPRRVIRNPLTPGR